MSDSPIWSRDATPETFGYDPQKQNLLGLPVVDERTDVSADQFAALAHIAAAVAATHPFISARIELRSGDEPVVHWAVCATGSMLTDVTEADEVADVGLPVFSRESDGVARIEIGSGEWTDLLGRSAAFTPSCVDAYRVDGEAGSVTYTIDGHDVLLTLRDGSGDPEATGTLFVKVF